MTPKFKIKAWDLDLRSLAFFRVLLGLLILLDLSQRARDLAAHYADLGVLPRSELLSHHWTSHYFSFHLLAGEAYYQAFLFLCAAVLAIGLLLGYCTRFCTLFSWLFLISLQNRNPVVLQGGDIYFRMILFWAIFLPLGSRHSVDSLRAPRVEKPSTNSLASFSYMFQIASVYLFAFLIKMEQPNWLSGQAMYYSYSTDIFASSIGIYLKSFPTLLEVLTYLSLGWEALGIVFVFCPFFSGPVRTLGVFGFWIFHVMISITLRVGLFTPIAVVAWSALLPAWFWEKIYQYAGLRIFLSKGILWGDRLLQKASTMLPEVTPKALSFWAVRLVDSAQSGMILIVLIGSFWWNLGTLEWFVFKYPKEFLVFSNTLRFDQRWNMFSTPILNDGWLVIPAITSDGSTLDLMTREAIHWQKPVLVSDSYLRQRWRKYFSNLTNSSFEAYRMYFGRYLCRHWNSTHSEDQILEAFTIIYMQETTLPSGGTAPIKRVMLWKHECFQGMMEKHGKWLEGLVKS